jgi:hypothetical protein
MRISDLLNPEFYDSILLRPRYQRSISWSNEDMNGFIGTIMKNGFVFPILMYELHPEDKAIEDKCKYDYEVPDGQHRLFTLNAFKSSALQTLPHISKPFIVHLCYETTDESGERKIERVYYKETPEVRDWHRSTYKKQGAPGFFNEAEKKRFNNFMLLISKIQTKLSFDDRREIFLDLQKGKPVRGSDLLKNQLSCKLMADFDENNYQDKMSVNLQYCLRKMTKYWSHWGTRYFLMFIEDKKVEDKKTPADIFLKTDPEIKKAIDNRVSSLKPSAEVFQEFDYRFCVFNQNLQRFGVKFNPTQLFALFSHFLRDDIDIDVIASHMPAFAKEGQEKPYKSLWESKGNHVERKDYFNVCLTQLGKMTTVAPDAPKVLPRVKSPMKKRIKVFEKATIKESCYTCGTKITLESFEEGHDIANILGGTQELSNLYPLCKPCNREMGILTISQYIEKREREKVL